MDRFRLRHQMCGSASILVILATPECAGPSQGNHHEIGWFFDTTLRSPPHNTMVVESIAGRSIGHSRLRRMRTGRNENLTTAEQVRVDRKRPRPYQADGGNHCE